MKMNPEEKLKKEKVIILDDNKLSIILYAEEYPENWKKVCKVLEDKENPSEPKRNKCYCSSEYGQCEYCWKKKEEELTKKIKDDSRQESNSYRLKENSAIEISNPADTKKVKNNEVGK